MKKYFIAGLLLFVVAEIVLIVGIRLGWLDKKETLTERAYAMDAAIHMPENPRAAQASPYPHIKPPEHLKSVELDVTFSKGKNSLVRISQKRAKEGWYVNAVRDIKKGKLKTLIEVDATLRDPTILMLAPIDEQGRASTEIYLTIPSKKILSGSVKESVAW